MPKQIIKWNCTVPETLTNPHGDGHYGTAKKFIGNVDVQVDYRALIYPSSNGVRTGLAFGGNTDFGTVERTSFGNECTSCPREVYLTNFRDGLGWACPQETSLVS